MGKASRKKRQQELRSGYILNGKSLISSEISSKWSLFNKPFIHILLISILGLLAYSNTFHVPFHLDDTPNIVANYKLRDLSNSWPPSESRWFGFLTFALNYYFGGLNTIGYHVVNLIIHIFNAILVYLFVMLTFKTPFFSSQQSEVSNQKKQTLLHPFTYLPLFIALLFVSHPIQTQAVTYIVQRFTSLATMLYLLSLVTYIKSRLSTLPATRYTLYAVSLISAILAMKTKEIAFTLPVVIALYEFMFFEGKIKNKNLYLIPILLAILIIPLSIINVDKPIGDAIGELREASQETEEIPRWSYLFTQLRVIVTYIRLLFLPINQNLDYDYPLYNSFSNPQVFLSFLFLLIILALGIYLLYAKRYTLSATRLISFGIFWFFITLSVESSIIPIRDVIFEHRLYLPVIGISIAFTSAIFYFVSRFTHYASRSGFPRWVAPTRITHYVFSLLLPIVVITLSIAAYQRNVVWQDGISLWEDVVRKSPQKARGHSNMGVVYKDKGMTDKAIEHYQIALRIKPDYAEAHNNLGNAYKDKGLTDKVIEEYQIALRLKPDYADARMELGGA